MIGILIKNRLRAVFGSSVGRARKGREIKKASGLKIVLFVLLYLFVVATFLTLSVSISISLAEVLLPGADWLYYLVLMTLSLTLIFIFGIFETKTELFECKDNDLLLSMPIKPRDIVFARIFVVLIYNYLINAIIMLPAILFYGLYTKNAMGVFGGIVIFLLIPLLATALASGVGYAVAEISKRLKNKSFFTILITLLFVFLYIYGYTALTENIDVILENLLGISQELAENYKLLYFIGRTGLLEPVPTLSLATVSLGAALIAYYLISSRYIKIVTDNRGVKKAVYKEKKLRTGSALGALVEKDIRHFISSPMYFLNGALSLIMCIAMGILAIVNRDMLLTLSKELSVSMNAVANAAIALTVLVSSFTIISACSLSVEGKGFWIMKSMPIKAKDALLSKALMQFVISAAPIFVTSVLMIIATSPSPLYWAVYIIAPQLASAVFSVTGILINTAFPKFDYENEAQAVKQSLATLLCMLVCMLFSIALLIGTIFISIVSALLGALFLLALPMLVLVLELLVLAGPASKRYDSFVL